MPRLKWREISRRGSPVARCQRWATTRRRTGACERLRPGIGWPTGRRRRRWRGTHCRSRTTGRQSGCSASTECSPSGPRRSRAGQRRWRRGSARSRRRRRARRGGARSAPSGAGGPTPGRGGGARGAGARHAVVREVLGRVEVEAAREAAAGADAAAQLQGSAAENRSFSEWIGAKGAEAQCVGRLHGGRAERRTKVSQERRLLIELDSVNGHIDKVPVGPRCQCHIWMENLTEWQ
uniref:Uncharacterized protein n=1 Tax=Setaria viridis TaxID=4556 RepID=A0A4U6V5P5_SETVI|nr:hypothetical protein SEVIR_3G055950v2 [Setaria viridis]